MKVAVVLGATAGTGRAIAQRLALDYIVVGFHRGNHPEAPSPGYLVRLDAGASREAVTDCAHEVEAVCHGTSSPVNVLVHAISGASVGPLMLQRPDQIARTFNYLAHSFLWWAQELQRRNLLVAGSRLIALSNPCPDFYLRDSGVIGAAKAALEAYVKNLAVELGPAGIRTNCLRFSTVLTPALEKVLGAEALNHLSKLHQSIVPARRMQLVEDVADFVSLIVKDDASWLNGAILDFTGGAPLKLMDFAFHGPDKR